MSKEEKNIGILGGGQLGMMLIESNKDDLINFLVLDPHPSASCKLFADTYIVGDLMDYETVLNFGQKCDTLTIEFEHVNVDALEKLESLGVSVYPQPHIIKIVQDKGIQKQFYKEHGFPTSPFQLIDEKHHIPKENLPCIQKSRRGGYDGKGVILLEKEKDLEKAFSQPSLIEDLVDIEKEISVLVARNKKGEIAVYEPVELIFHPKAHLVDYLIAPSTLSESQIQDSQSLAKSLIEKLDMVGLLAVEFFLSTSGEILINEIAPRPHNSGHQTIEANSTSQYEQHLNAILNLTLGDTSLNSTCVMYNLLGEPGYVGSPIYEGIESLSEMENVFVHLYEKKETKPYRKMGHITIMNSSLKEAKKQLNDFKKMIKIISA